MLLSTSTATKKRSIGYEVEIFSCLEYGVSCAACLDLFMRSGVTRMRLKFSAVNF